MSTHYDEIVRLCGSMQIGLAFVRFHMILTYFYLSGRRRSKSKVPRSSLCMNNYFIDAKPQRSGGKGNVLWSSLYMNSAIIAVSTPLYTCALCSLIPKSGESGEIHGQIQASSTEATRADTSITWETGRRPRKHLHTDHTRIVSLVESVSIRLPLSRWD